MRKRWHFYVVFALLVGLAVLLIILTRGESPHVPSPRNFKPDSAFAARVGEALMMIDVNVRGFKGKPVLLEESQRMAKLLEAATPATLAQPLIVHAFFGLTGSDEDQRGCLVLIWVADRPIADAVAITCGEEAWSVPFGERRMKMVQDDARGTVAFGLQFCWPADDPEWLQLAELAGHGPCSVVLTAGGFVISDPWPLTRVNE